MHEPNIIKSKAITMKTIKTIFIIIVLAIMMYTLGSCTTHRLCPTYTDASLISEMNTNSIQCASR